MFATAKLIDIDSLQRPGREPGLDIDGRHVCPEHSRVHSRHKGDAGAGISTSLLTDSYSSECSIPRHVLRSWRGNRNIPEMLSNRSRAGLADVVPCLGGTTQSYDRIPGILQNLAADLQRLCEEGQSLATEATAQPVTRALRESHCWVGAHSACSYLRYACHLQRRRA